MDVRTRWETAHKAQPGRAGEAAAGRKETPMKTQTFGIEIEMNHITRQRAAQVVAETLGEGATFRHTGGAYDAWEVTAPDGRRWKLVSDASIAGPRDQGTEFVSPICRWEDIETVQACVRALRAAGAHADPSCGIHVHVGLGEHTPKTLRNLVNLVNAKEELLTQALQISPERRSRWCQPVDPDFLATLNRRKPATSEDFARIWYDDRDWAYHAHQHYDPSRYHLLNLHSVFQKGTIEFRAFNSTLHAGEVKAYIQLCLAISHQALTVASASPARPVTDNPAYTFRCWLLRLGMNGEEWSRSAHGDTPAQSTSSRKTRLRTSSVSSRMRQSRSSAKLAAGFLTVPADLSAAQGRTSAASVNGARLSTSTIIIRPAMKHCRISMQNRMRNGTWPGRICPV